MSKITLKEFWIGDLRRNKETKDILNLLSKSEGSSADIDFFSFYFPKGKKSNIKVWLLYKNNILLGWSAADNSNTMNFGIGKKDGETGIYVFVDIKERRKGHGSLLAKKAISFAYANGWKPKGFSHSPEGFLMFKNLGL